MNYIFILKNYLWCSVWVSIHQIPSAYVTLCMCVSVCVSVAVNKALSTVKHWLTYLRHASLNCVMAEHYNSHAVTWPSVCCADCDWDWVLSHVLQRLLLLLLLMMMMIVMMCSWLCLQTGCDCCSQLRFSGWTVTMATRMTPSPVRPA